MFHQFLILVIFTILLPINAMQSLKLSDFDDKRVLIITAHPDDAEGFSGGLVAALQQRPNVTVSYLIITSGNAGGKCYTSENTTKFYSCEKEELAFLRRKESLAAAKFLGASNVWRLGLDDGLSVAYHETRIRRAIAAYVRFYKPHIVISHSPYPDWHAPPTCNGLCPAPNNWDDLGYHPDHQHVGNIVFNSLYGGGSSVDNDLLFEDLNIAAQLTKWKIDQLYMFALTKPTITHYFEMDIDLLNKKVDASALHKSQYQNVRPLQTFQWVAKQIGQVANVSFAEGYQGWF
jgi:LmbE family N-acetylglucosaminyl deacetylase